MPSQAERLKYLRYNIQGNAHGLSFSCYRNPKFLNYDRTRVYFVKAVAKAKAIHEFDVWAYVIMQEHVHLVIFPKNERYSISDILKSIKLAVSKRAINYLLENKSGILKFMETGVEKPRYRFWQDGGGYDRNIRDTVEPGNLIEYIHNNPVRRGLVERPDEWIWSSAREWLTGEPGPIRIDKDFFPII